LNCPQVAGFEVPGDIVRTAHTRKRGFLAAFEHIVSGKSERSNSFDEQAQEQWKRMTS